MSGDIGGFLIWAGIILGIGFILIIFGATERSSRKSSRK